MTEIALFVTDRNGNRFTSLPQATLEEVTWELTEAGSFAFSIDPLAEGAREIRLIEREVQIWADGQIIHWGVPWSCDGGSNGLTFQCEGVLSLLTKRYVDRASMDYWSVDQFSIAWDLLSYAQSEANQAHRELNISASNFSPSGVPRSPRYNREEHPNILDLLREFTEMSNGFEYDIVLSPDGTKRYWTPYYPRKGSFKPEFHMRHEVDKARNILDFSYVEDGKQILTHAYVTGGSNGDIRFEQNYEDVAASAQFGVMQEVISDGSEKDVGWLLDKAISEVSRRKEPLVQTEITSVTTDNLKLGDVVTGDWVPVTIDLGRIQASDSYRVKTVQWTPNDETLAFGFDGEAVS